MGNVTFKVNGEVAFEAEVTTAEDLGVAMDEAQEVLMTKYPDADWDDAEFERVTFDMTLKPKVTTEQIQAVVQGLADSVKGEPPAA